MATRSSRSTVPGCSRSATCTSTGSRPHIASLAFPAHRRGVSSLKCRRAPLGPDAQIRRVLPTSTRAGAALALLALAAAIASEQFAEHLWVRHRGSDGLPLALIWQQLGSSG